MQPKKPFGKRSEITEPSHPPQPLREIPEVDPRRAARKRIIQRGKLCFGPDFEFTIDCVINDISDTGARVQIEPGPTVPAEVFLVHLRAHAAYEAVVAWRRRGSIGLKLAARHDLSEPGDPKVEVLRQYCVEGDLR